MLFFIKDLSFDRDSTTFFFLLQMGFLDFEWKKVEKNFF